MESANGLQFNHCPLNHCPLLHGFAHLTVHIILKLHSGTAVTGRALNLGGGRVDYRDCGTPVLWSLTVTPNKQIITHEVCGLARICLSHVTKHTLT